MYFHLHIFHQHLQYGLPGLQAEVRQRETTDHMNKTLKDLLNLSFLKGINFQNQHKEMYVPKAEKGDMNV